MDVFRNAGKSAGIEIWRVENFAAVPYPKQDYGKFFTGDSYIVLQTSISLRDWNLFFWLGTETTQDESGSAAILSCQLDESLGGGPVQYREIQEHESQAFLSLFPNGVRYADGGIASGFNKVDLKQETRFFHIKGKRNVRVKQVTPSINSMNQGDCFILDKDGVIRVYVGPKSRNLEKIKAISAANSIKEQDHNGRATIEIIDEFSSDSDYLEFFEALGGGTRSAVPDESAGGDDSEFESTEVKTVTLYKISDSTGELKVDKIAEKPLQQSQLDTNDCFIVDTGSSILVWVGKQCTDQEKKASMQIAQKFIEQNNYPKWTRIQRIVEGAESGTFKQYFISWKASDEKRKTMIRSDSSLSDADFEPRLIHAQIPTNGSKWLEQEVPNFTQNDLNEDDVMILDHGPRLFVWIGKGADDNERQGCDKLINEYLGRLARDPKKIIVNKIEQGEETPEFKKAFPNWSQSLKQINYRDLL